MLYYFKQLGLDINSKDSRGSTPLHWAWFSKSEIAISYLLAWNVKINEEDQRGLTPLHLAIKAVNDLNSTRPVRALLISGASRKKKDSIGRRPIDLIWEVQDEKLRKELKEILKPPLTCSWLMLRTPLTKMKKRPTTMLFYVLVFLILLADQFLFILPWTVDFNNQKYIIYGLCGFGGLCLLSLIISSWKNPGYLEKPKIPFLNLLDKFDATLLCPECEVIRTPRSRHWSIWNRWVERFDHHCPWINNWVGLKNHMIFLFFLLFTEITLVLIIVLVVLKFNDYQLAMSDLYSQTTNGWIYYIPSKIPTFIYQKEIIIGVKIATISIAGLFALPLLLLILIQFKNFWSAQTTSERFSRHKNPVQPQNLRSSDSSTDSINSKLLNKEDEEANILYALETKRGWWGNWWDMCWSHKIERQEDLYSEYIKN